MRNIFIFLSLILVTSPSFAGKKFNYTGTWLRQLGSPSYADPNWVMKINQQGNSLTIDYPYSRLRFNQFRWNLPGDAVDIVYRDENIEVRHISVWRRGSNDGWRDTDLKATEEIWDRKTGEILFREWFKIEALSHPDRIFFTSSSNYKTEIAWKYDGN